MARYTNNVSCGGLSFSGGKNREADNEANYKPVIPAGKTVTSWVKIDGNTATCNLPGGHGYTNGVFDVFWEGGRRYGVSGTIVTNALSLDNGTGDDFPASATVGVVVCRQVQINIGIDGDNLALVAFKAEFANQLADAQVSLTFFDDTSYEIAHLDLEANRVKIIDVEGNDDNPFANAAPITYAMAGNGNPDAAVTIKIGVAQDSTP
jgi:hypothetical protein